MWREPRNLWRGKGNNLKKPRAHLCIREQAKKKLAISRKMDPKTEMDTREKNREEEKVNHFRDQIEAAQEAKCRSPHVC